MNRRCRHNRMRRSACSEARTGRRISTIRKNRKFVAGYEAAYNSVPGTYGFQAYDAAMLDRQRGQGGEGRSCQQGYGDGGPEEGRLHSLRGGFKFNTNGYPIQDFYLTKVAKRSDGKFQTEIVPESIRELRRPLCQGLHAGQLNDWKETIR